MQWVLWENDFLFLNWCFKVKILPFLYGQLDYFIFHFSEKTEAWFKAAKCTNYFSRMEGYSFLIHGCVISLVEIEMCACIVHLMCDNFIWYVICPYFVFPLPWKPQPKKNETNVHDNIVFPLPYQHNSLCPVSKKERFFSSVKNRLQTYSNNKLKTEVILWL